MAKSFNIKFKKRKVEIDTKKIYSIKTNPIKLFAETVSIVYSTAKRPKYITDPKPILKIADYTDSVSSKYSCDSYA